MKKRLDTVEVRTALKEVDEYLTNTLAILDRSLRQNRAEPFPDITPELYALQTRARWEALSSMQIWLRYNLQNQIKTGR